VDISKLNVSNCCSNQLVSWHSESASIITIAMSLAPVTCPRLVLLQYKQKLYSIDLRTQEMTLHRVRYPSGSLVCLLDGTSYACVYMKQAELINVHTGVVQEVLSDPPKSLTHTAVVCSPSALFAFCTNSRLYKYDFPLHQWSALTCSVDKVPSVWCRVGENQVLMLYAHTLWITSRYNLAATEAIEGRIYDLITSEMRSFSLKLDLLGRFGCIQVRQGEVLIFGGYEQLKGSGTVLMDNNQDLFLLDLINLTVRKVGVLPKALEESNITCLPVLWNGRVHFLSGMELVQIDVEGYEVAFTKLNCLYFRAKLKLIWVLERLKRGRSGSLGTVPWGLIREVARYLTAYAPN